MNRLRNGVDNDWRPKFANNELRFIGDLLLSNNLVRGVLHFTRR